MSSPEKPGTETTYQLGTAVVEGQQVGQKQGHKCCGGCCDVRRAVMIVNMVNIVVLLLGLVGILASKNIADNANVDDDATAAALEEYKNMPLGAVIATIVIKIFMSGCGIAGGYYYNIWLTGIAAINYVVEFIWSLVLFSFGGAIYAAFFAYPHYFFIQEVRQGIMSPENYPNEKQSCCCV